MFDRPGLALLISYAAFPNLAAYALVSWIGVLANRGMDALGWVCVLFVGIESLYAIVIHLQVEMERIRRDEELPASHPQPVTEHRQIPNLGEPIYEGATPLVKIDVMGIKIKRCCRTLINQRENGFQIDLREETWKAQFGGRDNFVYFRDVVMQNAFTKQDPQRKNSPFVVADWKEVLRGANGDLPH